jgi:hypothetical protein
MLLADPRIEPSNIERFNAFILGGVLVKALHQPCWVASVPLDHSLYKYRKKKTKGCRIESKSYTCVLAWVVGKYVIGAHGCQVAFWTVYGKYWQQKNYFDINKIEVLGQSQSYVITSNISKTGGEIWVLKHENR